MNQSIDDVLNFWFSDENAKKWFRSSDAFDAEISHRFESLWQSALKGQLDSWAETCFNKRNLQSNLRFAKHHRAIIVDFGRFPHRNALLGRESTADELAYLQSKRAFKG